MCMGSPVSRLSSIFGNSAIFEAMPSSELVWQSQPQALSAILSYALEAGSVLQSRRCLHTHARLKGLSNDLGRHFLKRDGAQIHYPCACVHFFTDPVHVPNEIDAALE